MLRAANSIYRSHFAVWPAKRSVLERAVCHLTTCSDNNASLSTHIPRDKHHNPTLSLGSPKLSNTIGYLTCFSSLCYNIGWITCEVLIPCIQPYLIFSIRFQTTQMVASCLGRNARNCFNPAVTVRCPILQNIVL